MGEVESQAISYTAGVPPVAAAVLVAKEIWNPKTMVNVEELDPDPFLEVLGKIGLPTEVEEKEREDIYYDGGGKMRSLRNCMLALLAGCLTPVLIWVGAGVALNQTRKASGAIRGGEIRATA